MKGGGLTTASALALAALGLTMCGGLVLGTRLFKTHRELDGELEILREAQTPGSAPALVGLAPLSAEHARETDLLRAAEAKAVALGKSLPPLSEEEWRSLGRVEELGWQAADFLGHFSEASAQMKSAKSPDGADANRLLGDLMAWMKRMEAIGEMEDDPAEIASLHTATLASRMKLDADLQARVRRQIEREFSQLREKKLTRPQRPGTERDDWYARRKTALDEAVLRIEALIPAGQRVAFAVGQSLHLGTGLVAKTEVRADGHGSVNMMIELPGIDGGFRSGSVRER